MKTFFLSLFFVLSFPALLFAHGGELLVTPETILQGEPFLVVAKGIDIREIKKLTWDGVSVPVFLYKGKPTTIVGVDLIARVGAHTLKLSITDGDEVKKAVEIQSRKKITAPLGIPQKLGGNTKQSQQNLVSILSKENGVLAKVVSNKLPWWGEPFAFPLAESVVTDEYGYSRATGSYSIPHKGTDFRADIGTPVRAINAGVVRLARDFTVYGKTVVIDHGGGVQSFSMHLSKLNVKEGQKVQQGDMLGLSGDSGYALSPHLHLSIRIGGVSIDPVKFFALFQ